MKITPEGRVKVLDFGLAKIYESPNAGKNVSQSPTLSGMNTAGGVILGTAAYMSPEQAGGENPVITVILNWAGRAAENRVQ